MSKPMRLDEFTRLPARARALTVDGLSGLVDIVADGASPGQRLFRYHWYAADLMANGGAAWTIVVEQDGDPVIAFPFTRRRRVATLLGHGWPARGFPARLEAGEAAFDALLDELGGQAPALLLGPVDGDDRSTAQLLTAARRRRWTVRAAPAAPSAPPDEALRHEARIDPIVAGALARATPPPAAQSWLIARPGFAGWIARIAPQRLR